jgi:hypothetical protein
MGLTLTTVVREVQRRTGYPRFKFIDPDMIVEIIKDQVIPAFTHSFPYKTYFIIYPETDMVDQHKYPGLFRITPTDCTPDKIYDTGMVFDSCDYALGGYARDMGRTVFGGAMGLGSVIYAQLQANLMSMIQPQQVTGEYIQPNFIQLYPKRRWYSDTRPIIIELLLYHADDLHTIPNSYELNFNQLAVLYARAYVYELYKDMEDETLAGHQVRTKIANWSDSEDKIDEYLDKLGEEAILNPDRLDWFIV